MKRALSLAIVLTLSAAGGFFAAACIGDEPGALPSTNADSGDHDVFNPGLDAGDAGRSQGLPATIPGLVLWLDGDDPDRVRRADPGRNENVTAWLDKSPSTPPRHFESVGASSPLFVKNIFNGRSALSFTRLSKQYLKGPSFLGLSGAEAFLVAQTKQYVPPDAATLVSYGMWQFADVGSYHPAHDNAWHDSFAYNKVEPGKPPEQGLFWPPPANEMFTPHILNVISNAQEWTASVDGIQRGTKAGSFGFPNGPTVVGGTLNSHLSEAAAPDDFFNGLIAEVIVYGQKLTTAEHDAVASYLSTKWGISLDGGK
ncbi:hypothetical protein [Pendulispora albinea]|uniref:LamG domain-containing protein n=1 Tax=Pendulispora albinea TaxID=2741071 RepID=A0ABZ2LXN2_9BACT